MKIRVNSNDGMNALQWIGFIAVLAGMMCFGSGCAGIELGGKVGIYRTDEHHESTRTYRNPKPAICYLLPSRCANQEQEQEQPYK